MPVPIRIRHPRGVSTIEVDPDTTTVDDLKVLIFSTTEIPPSEQEIKYGYPPRPLPLTADTLASIPIGRGEQLIITSNPDATPSNRTVGSSAAPASSYPSATPTPPPPVKALNQALSAPSPHIAQPSSTASTPSTFTKTADSVALPGRDAGHLTLRIVPDDNSCLFSAIAIVFEGGIEAAQQTRQIVVEEIRNDPDTWPDVVLGQSRDSYISKMADKNTWGGAIELSIFAKHYKTEISSFDVATGRCDRFGEGQYDNRCLLVYSGIHYDAITLSPVPDAPASFHTTVFPLSDAAIIPAAEKLVSQLKARRYYTDTANFDLRCGICQVGLKGEKGARDHAMQTGHVEFGEY